ncbi:FAD-dependent oxidoreductase [Euzebya rosea]|uniref:FAD-dependent oxidoreductase n=1 Tax=Euzebya rosea TaxID=2052804 RepID=UPI000D3E0487|nr:FAD-dependent oxidoreductase [Euzebya rosea]
MTTHDVVVLGAGAMGLATAHALAGRGRRVALVERFEPGHARGSSHATARVFRLGYEDADYIALARAALPRWRDLEARTGASLLELTGVVDHGPADAIAPITDAFVANDVEHEVLDPERAAARWPGMRFDAAVVHHPTGGRVAAQRTLDVLLQRTRQHGADVRVATAVVGVDVGDGGVAVRLDDGSVLRADRIVSTVGAWTQKVLDGVVALPPMQVSAEQPMFFRPVVRHPGEWLPAVHRGVEDVYLFGVPGEGVKVSEHYRPEWLDPDDRPFDEDTAATARLADYIRRWLPGIDPTPVSMTRCLYTTTPDRDFVLDRVDRVVIGAGFSGHGFKFTPAIGEVLADLAEGASQSIERFRIRAGTRTAGSGVK